ncbi:hypothetical protein L7F22_003569, partial [Adiantum nelumboides]|nr:hypothetical protein [Adiantum nelumboides]
MYRVAKGFDTFVEKELAKRIVAKREVFEDEADTNYLDMLLCIYNGDRGVDRDSIKFILRVGVCLFDLSSLSGI